MMQIEHARIRKILYINLAFLGDLILSTPTVRALRKQYPQAQIDLLVTPWAAPAAQGNPYADNVLLYDKRGVHKNIKNLWHLLRQLRSENYDLAITANFAIRGAVLAWLIGACYRIGYGARHAGVFLTHKVSADRTVIRHETENQLGILAPLGITTQDTSLSFRINPVDVQSLHAKIVINNQRPVVILCPYGRHPLNQWTPEGYTSLIKQLSDIADCYLIGGNAEAALLAAINAAAGNVAEIAAGILTIGEMAAFFQEASLLITVDTGPMHIAGAVGIPILALFGRSDPRVWGPRGTNDVVLQKKLDCVPCIIPRECAHHRCMKELSVAIVLETARKMLENRKI